MQEGPRLSSASVGMPQHRARSSHGPSAASRQRRTRKAYFPGDRAQPYPLTFAEPEGTSADGPLLPLPLAQCEPAGSQTGHGHTEESPTGRSVRDSLCWARPDQGLGTGMYSGPPAAVRLQNSCPQSGKAKRTLRPVHGLQRVWGIWREGRRSLGHVKLDRLMGSPADGHGGAHTGREQGSLRTACRLKGKSTRDGTQSCTSTLMERLLSTRGCMLPLEDG